MKTPYSKNRRLAPVLVVILIASGLAASYFILSFPVKPLADEKNNLPGSRLPVSAPAAAIDSQPAPASVFSSSSSSSSLNIPVEVAIITTASPAVATSTKAAPAAAAKKREGLIDQEVPFTPQAPLAAWSDERQQDGCEEAASLMALAWAGIFLAPETPAAWERAIVALADFEEKEYGEFRDAALTDIQEWIFADRFGYQKTVIREASSSAVLVSALEAGGLLLVPCDGRLLPNPYFTAPGPETHLVLVKGYDYATQEFITNDPGTKRGANYRYPAERLFGAISPYPTGNHEPRTKTPKAFLLVEK